MPLMILNGFSEEAIALIEGLSLFSVLGSIAAVLTIATFMGSKFRKGPIIIFRRKTWLAIEEQRIKFEAELTDTRELLKSYELESEKVSEKLRKDLLREKDRVHGLQVDLACAKTRVESLEEGRNIEHSIVNMLAQLLGGDQSSLKEAAANNLRQSGLRIGNSHISTSGSAIDKNQG